MADIRIRAGSSVENVSEDRRAEIEQFASELDASGLTAEVEVIERVPGRFGMLGTEMVGIFIGTGVSSALVSKITGDVYDAAKRWLKKRRERTGTGRHLGFTIYGPDGDVLKKWSTKEDEPTTSTEEKKSE